MSISDWSSDLCSSDLLTRIQRSGIAGAFTRAKLEVLFVGSHRDTDFRLVEAHLHRKRRTGGRTRRNVFSGLLCEVSVPVPFAAVVLLVGDRGTRGGWVAGIMRHNFPAAVPVTRDHPPFAGRYRVPRHDPTEGSGPSRVGEKIVSTRCA